MQYYSLNEATESRRRAAGAGDPEQAADGDDVPPLADVRPATSDYLNASKFI